MVFGELGTNFHHPLRVVDGNHFSSSSGKQLRQHSFACSQVSDINRRYQRQEQMCQSLPGSSGAMATSELPSQLVKILPSAISSLGENMIQRRAVRICFRHFTRG